MFCIYRVFPNDLSTFYCSLMNKVAKILVEQFMLFLFAEPFNLFVCHNSDTIFQSASFYLLISIFFHYQRKQIDKNKGMPRFHQR